MKRVIIVHQWGSRPNGDWYPWLQQELEERGVEVLVPAMPNPDTPVIKEWVTTLVETTGEVTEDTYFVGHSVGCQTLLRFFEKQDTPIAGAVFVAGWFEVTNLEAAEQEVAKPWLETPINFDHVRRVLTKSAALFSDDDEYVPVHNADLFKKHLGSEIRMCHGRGHFAEWDDVTEVPEVLDAVLRLAKD